MTDDQTKEALRHCPFCGTEPQRVYSDEWGNFVRCAQCLAQAPEANWNRRADADPISMILPCPRCHQLHVDAPEPEKGWTNPPHKSHLCHSCGLVWRPADVPTYGVAAISTAGKDDTWKPGEKPPESTT